MLPAQTGGRFKDEPGDPGRGGDTPRRRGQVGRPPVGAPHGAPGPRRRPDDLGPVWKALSSEVRREMLDALRDGPLATGEIALLFPELTRFAVMQHLKVLIRANLVVTRKEGRIRTNFLNPVPIQQIYERWMSNYEALWAGMLTDLKSAAEDPSPTAETQTRPKPRTMNPRDN